MIEPLFTARLCLRTWTEDERDDFAAMNQDPDVMNDLGGPIDRAAGDRKLDRFQHACETVGHGRWVIERIPDGRFCRICRNHAPWLRTPAGLARRHRMAADPERLGLRLRDEAATAAQPAGFERVGLDEVLALTSADNVRSQAVIHRLGLVRDAGRDFTIVDDVMGPWNGLVWSARNPASHFMSH